MRRGSSQRQNLELLHYYRELLETWAHRLGNRHDAADIAHDAIVRILEVEPATIHNLRAYLHQTARNLAADAFRHSALHEVVPIELVEDQFTANADSNGDLRTGELVAALEDALKDLPERVRQAFVWHRIGGLTRAEIAKRLSVSTRMVQKYISRATAHLRERMAPFHID